MNQELVLDVGGDLYFDPARKSRPTSATVALYTPGGAEHVASASATLDTANTTLASGASAGDTSISLSSATGFTVGAYYLIEGADGLEEEIRAARIVGSTLHIEQPLAYAYSSGAAVFGRRVSVSLSGANATPIDEGYEARWVITYADSTTERINTLFDVVRSKWPETLLSWGDFRRYAGPSLSGRVMQATDFDGLQFQDEIAESTERVRRDLLERGHRSGLFRSFDAFRKPIVMACIAKWAADRVNIPPSQLDDPDGWATYREEIYIDAISDALNVTRSYDENDDGTVSESERTRLLGGVHLRS
jgi:hypothetical protein